MGMTIDEALKIMSDIDKAYRTFSNLDYSAMQKSINIMRKYQKIEQIVKAWNDMNSFDSMKQIREVLEDGKDNI